MVPILVVAERGKWSGWRGRKGTATWRQLKSVAEKVKFKWHLCSAKSASEQLNSTEQTINRGHKNAKNDLAVKKAEVKNVNQRYRLLKIHPVISSTLRFPLKSKQRSRRKQFCYLNELKLNAKWIRRANHYRNGIPPKNRFSFARAIMVVSRQIFD